MSAQAGFAQALLDPQVPCPGDLRAWNGSDVGRRFAVYRNNVIVSLVNALADSFPVVQELVGPEFFRAMAAAFVRAHPPRSALLLAFGAEFPSFVDGFSPAQSVPYLGDVARLELARVEAFHAADAPGRAEPGPPVLLHPSVRVVRSRFPVYSIWAAHQGVGELETVDLGRAEAALVVRPALDVLVVPMAPAAAMFLQPQLHGAPLSGDAGPDLAEMLAFLLHHRAIASIHLPSGDLP